VVEHDGEPVAFLVMVPELAEVTRLDGLGLARFASRRLANRSVLRHGRAACVLIIGVDPRHRGGGLGLVLTAEMVRMVERFGLEAFTTTFVHEANHATLALTRRLELEPVRSLRLFAFGEPDPGDVRP